MTTSSTGRDLDLGGLELDELEAELERLGEPRFRGRQIFEWIHQHGVTDPGRMTNIPGRLRESLAASRSIDTPALVDRESSSDGTVKSRLRLGDGREIEAVFIPDTPAQTLCLSTQVGCAMACAFCLTGLMGWVRHLSAGEIVGQVRKLAADHGLLGRRFNLVLMGMGEPLHNYDATMKALRVLTSAQGLGMSPRRITLSTVGLVPALDRLAGEGIMPNLAVSLHATTDELRNRLVPTNRKYGVEDLVAACRRFPLAKRARITFEYVLLSGVNDSAADARQLARLLSDLKSKVNLLPFNEAPGLPFVRPSETTVNAFAKTLSDRGVIVSVRKSRGRDIRAACGQLIVEGPAASPAQRLASHLPPADH